MIISLQVDEGVSIVAHCRSISPACCCSTKSFRAWNPYSVLCDVDVDRLLLDVLDENADGNMAVVLVPLVSSVLNVI
jgi:hypothetical protein